MIRRLAGIFLIAVVWAGLASAAPHASFSGKVIAIADGDTITVLAQGARQETIRLVEIDAPERGQPWGSKARDALSGLVFARTVEVRPTGTDRYGRTLGRVFVEGSDVNLEMVRIGAAWAFDRYVTDRRIVAAENQARSARRGLWSLPSNQTVAPWEWRQGVRSEAASRTPDTSRRNFSSAPGSAASSSCGAKRYCSEMESCKEARRYLSQCGLSSLDGDGDGVPCEKLC